MWLVACSFLLLALRTQGHQHWRKEPILLRTYPVEDTAEPTLVKEPPILKRAVLMHGGLKRDVSVYPAAGSQLMPRVPLREPPLKRSTEYFVERRSEYPIDLLRLPLREPPLVKKRSLPYPEYMHIPIKEPPLKRSLDAILSRRRWLW